MDRPNLQYYLEEDYLLISGIQHYLFCRRQWGLIHIEQLWGENYLTSMGRLMHKTVHEEGRKFERRGSVLITRGLPVRSRVLGFTGLCDVVEFHESEDGVALFGIEGRYIPIPVEYKRGKAKIGDEDILQLVAQAVCLEEMLACHVEDIALYYGQNRRRISLKLDDEMRDQLAAISNEMHANFRREQTPKAKYEKKCGACSLLDQCLPQAMTERTVEEYIDLAVKK